MSISRREGMNEVYRDWGPDYVMCPAWVVDFCQWMLTPTELQEWVSVKAYALAHEIPHAWLVDLQNDRQFIEMRKAIEREAGFTEAHLYEVRRNLYRLASQSNDIRAVRLFLDLMQEGPKEIAVKGNVIDVEEVDDEALNDLLAQRGLAELPAATETSPEED